MVSGLLCQPASQPASQSVGQPASQPARTRAYPCSEDRRTEPGVQSESRPEHSVFEQLFRMKLEQRCRGPQRGRLSRPEQRFLPPQRSRASSSGHFERLSEKRLDDHIVVCRSVFSTRIILLSLLKMSGSLRQEVKPIACTKIASYLCQGWVRWWWGGEVIINHSPPHQFVSS